jgi:hypothetical protein
MIEYGFYRMRFYACMNACRFVRVMMEHGSEVVKKKKSAKC